MPLWFEFSVGLLYNYYKNDTFFKYETTFGLALFTFCCCNNTMNLGSLSINYAHGGKIKLSKSILFWETWLYLNFLCPLCHTVLSVRCYEPIAGVLRVERLD